jgi:hypothetical protein
MIKYRRERERERERDSVKTINTCSCLLQCTFMSLSISILPTINVIVL